MDRKDKLPTWRVRTKYQASKSHFGQLVEASSRQDAKERFTAMWNACEGAGTKFRRVAPYMLVATKVQEREERTNG